MPMLSYGICAGMMVTCGSAEGYSYVQQRRYADVSARAKSGTPELGREGIVMGCPRCGQENSEQAQFWQGRGAPLQEPSQGPAAGRTGGQR